MERLGRRAQGCGPLSLVPLLARRVSTNQPEVCDAGHRRIPHGVALDAAEVLLYGLPFHLAEGRTSGTGARSSRLALQLEILAPGARLEAQGVLKSSTHRRDEAGETALDLRCR